MNIKISRSLRIFLATIFLLDLFVFVSIYFLGIYDLRILLTVLALYFIASFIFWIVRPVNMFIKPFHILATFILASITGLLALILAINLLDYIESKICFPAIEKYYKEKGIPLKAMSDMNTKGEFRSWIQHEECEENVRYWKGPVFSENPPGFRKWR